MEELTKLKWYKHKWVWVIGTFLVLVVIGNAMTANRPINPVSVIEPVTATSTSTLRNSALTSSQTATASISLRGGSDVYKVVKVVDGDTLDVDIAGKTTRLRLIGIDTPEVVDPRKPVQCFGREASAKAKELLSGQSVRLESDPTQGELDKYGRTLRYVFLSDGRSFNKLMIEEGYAHEYTYNTPYKYQIEFKKAQKTAEANKKGLWADNACDMAVAIPDKPVTNSASQPTSQALTSHIFYVSSYHTARYYYCDTDTAWKGLSSKYLKSFPTEAELLKAFPDKTLHEGCK